MSMIPKSKELFYDSSTRKLLDFIFDYSLFSIHYSALITITRGSLISSIA